MPFTKPLLRSYGSLVQKIQASCVPFASAHSTLQSVSLPHQAQKALEVGSGHAFVAAVKACTHKEDVAEGKLLHSHIIRSGLEMDPYVGNTLIDMYAKCGSLDDARRVFDGMPSHDLVAWNTMITGFAQNGHGQCSLQFFHQMQHVEMVPNRITYICVLKACSSICALDDGKLIHACIVENSAEANVSIGNSLVDMYAKCMSLENAQRVFDRLLERDVITWSTMISGFCEQDHGEEALHLFLQMQHEGLIPTHATFFCALKACAIIPTLEQGMLIHAQIIENGFELDVSIGNTLIDMYAKCASFRDSYKVFEKLPKRDVVTWTSMLANLASHGSGQEALKVFQKMQSEGVKPNQVTYLSILKVCSSMAALDEGRLIHAHILEYGFASVLVLGNTLLDMYAKCGSLNEARKVFDCLPNRDAVTWSAMISGYAQHEHNQEALQLFKEMQVAGFRPNQITYVSILKLGSSMANLNQGKFMHSHIIKHGFDSDIWVGNSLINMYIKCGSIVYARKTFDTLAWRDVVTWSAMITGYAQGERVEEAFHLFERMLQAGIRPNQVTFLAILKACSTITVLNKGKLVHAHIVKYGHESDVCVGNALTNMYMVCGELEDAKSVLDNLQKRDVVTWTVMIAGHAQNEHFEEALYFFYKMQQEGIEPNHATFISIFKACSTPAALNLGKTIHVLIVEGGLDLDISIANSLIHMYGKCGSLVDALAVFGRLPYRDVVTWSILIAALAEHGLAMEALHFYDEMQQNGLEPNHVTLLSILKACSSIGNLEEGQMIHAHICESQLESDISIGNTLIDMYAKCGTLINAHKVFDQMSRRDVVTWSALIEGCVQQEHSQEALHHFGQMLHAGMVPNRVTFLSVLGACCSIVAIEQGKLIHAHVIEHEFQSDVNIGSALIDMYTKCGSCQDAGRVFVDLPKQNAVAWSSMVSGYAQCYDYKMALQYFKGMQKQGLKPDDVTFLSLLSACNHAGLVDEGLLLLKSTIDHGVELQAEHYNCIMDLLGRTGHLEEAEVMLETLPFHLGVVGLTSLLGHSKTHGDLSLGTRCFRCMLDVDKRNAAGYVLLSNAYARAGMKEEADNLEGMRKLANAWKKPGKASIEINSEVLDFVVEDRSHAQSVEAYAKLQRLALQMKEKGYSPQLRLALDNCLEYDKDNEDALCGQSEDGQDLQASLQR